MFPDGWPLRAITIRCLAVSGDLESTRRFVAANASRRRSEEFREVEPAEISRRETNEIPRF